MSDASAEQTRDAGPKTSDAVLGDVHAVNGSQVSAGLLTAVLNGPRRADVTVGKFFKIQSTKAVLVGVITNVSIESASLATEPDYCALAHVNLMGEIDQRDGEPRFQRGVSHYPTIGDTVLPLTNEELRVVFGGAGTATISVGKLQQSSEVDACVEIDEMLGKHFAVLGSTGVGKSTGVAHILQQIMHVRPQLRIFLIDAHNEYDRCLGERAQVVNSSNLQLPFWLFNFDEVVDVFFGARLGSKEEIDVLSEAIPLAKTRYAQDGPDGAAPRLKKKTLGFTPDTPVPYRLTDLTELIDERMGKLENRTSRMIYHKLISRIEAVSNDPRYAFMFAKANVGGDTMAAAISHLFRIPINGKPATILQLAGFPVEVVDSVISVLTRLAFDFGLWSDGSDPLLIVCEEAHKYAPADQNMGFAPTRRAISRIAKEGRKYGISLGLITQRPAELDPTIISQCGTLFAMRMSNDRDQALLRSAVSDTGANLLDFVPSLGTREALVVGAGIPLPTRMKFAELPNKLVPRSDNLDTESGLLASGHDLNFISSVVARWRSMATVRDGAVEEVPPVRQTTPPVPVPVPPPAAPDPDRFSLLKAPSVDEPGSTAA